LHRLNINIGVGFRDHEESDSDLGSGFIYNNRQFLKRNLKR